MIGTGDSSAQAAEAAITATITSRISTAGWLPRCALSRGSFRLITRSSSTPVHDDGSALHDDSYALQVVDVRQRVTVNQDDVC